MEGRLASKRHIWVFALSVIMLLFVVLLICTKPASAKTINLKIGEGYNVTSFPGTTGNYDDSSVEVKTTNKKVANAKLILIGENDRVYIYATGPGKAKVTISWKSTDIEGYGTDSTVEKTITNSFSTNVVVKKSAKIEKRSCMYLFTGTKYKLNSLFKGLKENTGQTFMAKQKSGKFLKGKGYKVYSKGKKIKFTKTGKKTVKYKYKSKTYKIYVGVVHSKAKLKSQLVKDVKNVVLPLYSTSTYFKLINTKYKNGAITMKYYYKDNNGKLVKASIVGSYKHYYDSWSDNYKTVLQNW